MISIEPYLLVKKIGKGNFGQVFYTTKNNSDKVYATKKVEKMKVEKGTEKAYFLNEIDVLRNCDHENIIKLYEIKSSKNNYYMIMEHLNGGNLMEVLLKYNNPFSEIFVQHILKDIAKGIYYLHKNEIIHRDLKLENILFNFENEDDIKNLNILRSKIKIIDFGFSRFMKIQETSSICGSPINMDPAILKALASEEKDVKVSYSFKADMWSIGVIVYFLLTGSQPFVAENNKELFAKTEKGEFTIPKHLKLSKQAISLINGLLMYDPEKRLSSFEMLYHEFLTKNVSDFDYVDLNYKNDNQDILLNNKEDISKIWGFYAASNNENINAIKCELANESFIKDFPKRNENPKNDITQENIKENDYKANKEGNEIKANLDNQITNNHKEKLINNEITKENFNVKNNLTNNIFQNEAERKEEDHLIINDIKNITENMNKLTYKAENIINDNQNIYKNNDHIYSNNNQENHNANIINQNILENKNNLKINIGNITNKNEEKNTDNVYENNYNKNVENFKYGNQQYFENLKTPTHTRNINYYTPNPYDRNQRYSENENQTNGNEFSKRYYPNNNNQIIDNTFQKEPENNFNFINNEFKQTFENVNSKSLGKKNNGIEINTMNPYMKKYYNTPTSYNNRGYKNNQENLNYSEKTLPSIGNNDFKHKKRNSEKLIKHLNFNDINNYQSNGNEKQLNVDDQYYVKKTDYIPLSNNTYMISNPQTNNNINHNELNNVNNNGKIDNKIIYKDYNCISERKEINNSNDINSPYYNNFNSNDNNSHYYNNYNSNNYTQSRNRYDISTHETNYTNTNTNSIYKNDENASNFKTETTYIYPNNQYSNNIYKNSGVFVSSTPNQPYLNNHNYENRNSYRENNNQFYAPNSNNNQILKKNLIN